MPKHNLNSTSCQQSTRGQSRSQQCTYVDAVKFLSSHGQNHTDTESTDFITDLLNKIIPHIITFLTSHLPTIKQFILIVLSSAFQNGSM